MATLKIIKRNQTLEIPLDHQNHPSLMKIILDAGVPVASSCGGEGICAKCLVTIEEGAASLPPPAEKELFLAQKLGWRLGQRLSCQCYPQQSLAVSCPYW